jgi:hypothetical protein
MQHPPLPIVGNLASPHRLHVFVLQLQQRQAEEPAAATSLEGGKGASGGGGWFGSDNSLRQELAALKDENKKLTELAARRGQVAVLRMQIWCCACSGPCDIAQGASVWAHYHPAASHA